MSIYRALPDRPSLEQLKAQAKELLTAARAGEPEALRRFEEAHPRARQILAGEPRLSDAQLVLAREYDFASWPALHDYVKSGASGGKARLRELLEQRDVAGVAQVLEAQPQLVSARFSPHNDTPLHLAVKTGSAPLVELLVERGAQLEAKNSWGGTPMVSALISDTGKPSGDGHMQIAELLLRQGARALTLSEAAGLGRVELLRSFWDAAGNLRPEAASRFGHELSPGVWQSASAAPADAREVVQTAFEYACRNGREEAASFLLEQGADVRAPGFFGADPLHWAASRGQDAMVRYLVARGADLTRRDAKFSSTPFGWAREFGRRSTMMLLRELGYRPDVWEAAGMGDVERLAELLDADASLLESPRWGTPLCEACCWGQETAARFLLERGARVDVTTRDGKRPIELARERGLEAIVRLIEMR